MLEYCNERREVAEGVALAGYIDQTECLLASPLGAASFAAEMPDPEDALALLLCQAVTLKDDKALGEAVRSTVKLWVKAHAEWCVGMSGPKDCDYEAADHILGRVPA